MIPLTLPLNLKAYSEHTEEKRADAETLRQRQEKREELAARDVAESSAHEQYPSEDETSEDERDQAAGRNDGREPPSKRQKSPSKGKGKGKKR